MKKTMLFLMAATFMLLTINPAEGALIDRGGGLIYDDLLDITWLQYANYTGSTMTWDQATSWAGSLIFQGYSDWRLPDAGICTGYNCTSGELGYLFYNEGISSSAPGPFIDVRSYMYWTSTDDAADASKAYRFHAGTGYQGISSKSYKRYAWAVRSGDSIAVAPEPASSVLLVAGAGILAAARGKKKIREG